MTDDSQGKQGKQPADRGAAPLPARRLGRSPVFVTEYSFGGAPLGNLFTAVTEDDARAAVDAAWDGGIRTFDTAPHYGLGLSERRLGDALRHRPRDEYVISTKVGRLLRPAARRTASTPRGSGSRPTTSGSSTTAPTASAAAWRRAWPVSALTGSTSRSSTIPTITASRRCARRTRRWRSSGRRAWSARSASA